MAFIRGHYHEKIWRLHTNKTRMKFELLNSHPDLPGANKLSHQYVLFQFFERMAAFEEEAWQNRKRLIQRMQREMSDTIEKRLASLHKLSKNEDGVPDALQGENQAGICRFFMFNTLQYLNKISRGILTYLTNKNIICSNKFSTIFMSIWILSALRMAFYFWCKLKIVKSEKLQNHVLLKMIQHIKTEWPHFSSDVSLPAVFMPQKSNNMLIFNPRAGRYFHPTGMCWQSEKN